tara:strand:+ start:1383 stop:1631 length:249 start_codon:yes stop_codon:yes gene_type:complete
MFYNLPIEEENKLTNGWWYNFKSSSREWKRPRIKGFPVRLCTKCDLAWQYSWNGSNNIIHFEDFPTYGLPRKTCSKCEVYDD